MSKSQVTIHDVLATLVANPSEFCLSDGAMRWIVENSIPAIQEICTTIETRANNSNQIENTYALVKPAKQKSTVRRPFCVKSKFLSRSIPGTEINLSSRFIEYFGRVEEQPIAPPRKFKFFKLTKNQVADTEIIADMGGIEKIGATLEEVYYLLKDQPEDGSGDLTKERNKQNIVYVQIDINRKPTIIAVTMLWTAKGWGLFADSLEGGFFQAVWQLKREVDSIVCVPS